jgi:hypothetical protein
MLEEAEAIPQKIPPIEPDEKPPNPKLVEKAILNTANETPSSSAKIQKIKKETHIMTEKRLEALRKARQSKASKRKSAMEAAQIEQDERFKQLSSTLANLDKKLDLLSQIPRESRANLPSNPMPNTTEVIEQGHTLSPVRRTGFQNIRHSSIQF